MKSTAHDSLSNATRPDTFCPSRRSSRDEAVTVDLLTGSENTTVTMTFRATSVRPRGGFDLTTVGGFFAGTFTTIGSLVPSFRHPVTSRVSPAPASIATGSNPPFTTVTSDGGNLRVRFSIWTFSVSLSVLGETEMYTCL